MIKKILSCFLLLFIVYGVTGQISNQPLPKKQLQKKNIPAKSTLAKSHVSTKSSKVSINGQWRGYFNSNGDIVSSGNDNIEYVLELDVQGSQVNGYSYSYFQNRAYYVICSLEGEYNKATKSITVTETARIKGATPPSPAWTDCLQTHILTYKKQGDTEMLTGSWKTAPGQVGDCGFGNTTLIRRTLQKDLASYNKSENNNPFSAPKHTIKTTPKLADNKKTKVPSIKRTPTMQPQVTEPQVAMEPKVEKNIPDNNPPQIQNNPTPDPVSSNINFEKRNNELMQTVEINHETFRVDLYDNGVIDGDSISLFYNGKLILAHQRLSDTAITLTLNVNTKLPLNELIMYADNLGTIPPNTALMVVTDGDNRYEVPVTSDLKTSGTIHFAFKPKTQ